MAGLLTSVPAAADTLSDCLAADTPDTETACSRIIDAEGDVSGAVPAWVSDIDAETPLSRERIRTLQRALLAVGVDAGSTDGLTGPRTRQATGTFQADRGLKATGEADDETLSKLFQDVTLAYALAVRGEHRRTDGKTDQALADFERAIALAPNLSVIYLRRGALHEGSGNTEAAIDDFDRALALNAATSALLEDAAEGLRVQDLADIDIHFRRGNAFLEVGDFDDALADYDRIIALAPEPRDLSIAHYNRGLALSRQEKHVAAIAAFDEAIRLEPTYAEAFTGRGYSHFAREDNARARDDADSAIAVAPTDPRGLVLRGDVSVADGDLASGLSDYRRALDLIADDDPYGQTLRDRMTTVEDALAVATAASKGQPDEPVADEASAPQEETADAAVADEAASAPEDAIDQAVADELGVPATQSETNPGRSLRLFAASIIVGVAGLEIDGEPSTVVTVDGEIKPGDEATFERALESVDRPLVLVSLNNPTGDWRTAMAIGRLVWAGEFRTLVVGARCGAPCALIWLAGRPRFAAAGTNVALQGAIEPDVEDAQVDSLADPALNALVGAYLSELGLTSAAITAIAAPTPEEAMSLTSDRARRLGIAAERWPTGNGE